MGRVRHAMINDLGSINRMHLICYTGTKPITEDHLSSYLVYEEDNGSILGYISDQNGWIRYLGVDPTTRHQGIGTKLVKAQIAKFKEYTAYKSTGVAISAGNQQAISFLQSLGFIAGAKYGDRDGVNRVEFTKSFA